MHSEVLEDHRRQVAQRPLWILGWLFRSAFDEEDGAERVTATERAVASTARVADATPVHALVSLGRRDQNVSGVG